jgi:hypothetical protein
MFFDDAGPARELKDFVVRNREAAPILRWDWNIARADDSGCIIDQF